MKEHFEISPLFPFMGKNSNNACVANKSCSITAAYLVLKEYLSPSWSEDERDSE